MTKRHLQLFSIGLLLLSALSVAGLTRFTFAAQEGAKLNNVARDPALKDLARYRQWTRANEEPLPVFNLSVAG